jgi:release factor glutamine methyltransferase
MTFDPSQVYSPAEDTFLLAAAAEGEVRLSDRVIEIGTGSGYIAALIQSRASFVVATEISPHAATAAHARGIDVVRTDLISGICGTFDLVLFNPPYLPTRPGERIDDWLEHALDGGTTGRSLIERFAREVRKLLAQDGRILLLVSSLTGPREVCTLFRELGMDSEVVCREPLEGEVLLVLRITCR